VLLPNGPESALCVMACTTFYTCAPLNCNLSPDELRTELTSLGCVAVIVPHPGCSLALATGTFDFLAHFFANRTDRGGILLLTPHSHLTGAFTLTSPRPHPGPANPQRPVPNGPDDVALVLHTSGTSGKKKVRSYAHHEDDEEEEDDDDDDHVYDHDDDHDDAFLFITLHTPLPARPSCDVTDGCGVCMQVVPYPLENIIVGSAVIMASWDLTPGDVNFNMMPLFQ
jgi:hypothetical protein